MLLGECFDDEFGRVILAGIQTPGTTIVLAADVKLVRIVPNYFCWEVVLNGVGCAGVFQRVGRVPFRADLEGHHCR